MEPRTEAERVADSMNSFDTEIGIVLKPAACFALFATWALG